MKVKVCLLAGVLALALCACSTDEKEGSSVEVPETEQSSISLEETENEELSLEIETQTTTQQEANEQPIYYGSWVIEDYSASGISAWSSEQLEERLGTVYEYTEKTFVSNGIILEEPQYNEIQETKADFEALWEGMLTFESLGITGDSITYVSVDNSYDVGSMFYVCGTDKLLIVSDGAFFTATREGENAFVIGDSEKAFLQSMCYYMPDWEDYNSLDEIFWENFLFASFTSPDMLEDGKVMTICGEAEYVTVYREDLGFEEGQIKISKEAVEQYIKLAMGCELPVFEPAFEDMEQGRTALYYEDGYYYIGVSDFGLVNYSFQEYQVQEDYILVKYDVFVEDEQQAVSTIIFTLCPADNQNGFVIISKETVKHL